MKKLLTSLLFMVAIFVTPVWAEMVNINKADSAALIENLPGIGEKKAKAIIAYRKKNGKFKSTADLLKVEGIGEKIYKSIKSKVSTSKGAVKATGKKPATRSTKKTTKTKSSKKKTSSNSSSSKSSSSKSKSKTGSSSSSSSDKKKKKKKKKKTSSGS